MAKNRPPITLVQALSLPPVLAAEEQRLYDEMIEGWKYRRKGAQRHTAKSFNRDIAVVEDFRLHTGLPPWLWTPEDFDRWCYHLGVERKLASATQRHYQSAIRNFMLYIMETVRFRTEVKRMFGIDLEQIAPVEACVPHVSENEAISERRAMTHDEIETFFQSIDDAITEAVNFTTKAYTPLRRDKALFFTIYAIGLRASEALGLNLESFYPDPQSPEMGNFGVVSVWGKGSRGSGPRNRHVQVIHPGVPAMLEWYLEEVRPALLVQADPNESAVFLSERGKRLALSTLEARFQNIISLARLEGLDLTPHCLRHSSATHTNMAGLSVGAVQAILGHGHAATTQRYIHLPPSVIVGEIRSVMRKVMSKQKDSK